MRPRKSKSRGSSRATAIVVLRPYIADGVLVTPHLGKLSPSPAAMVIGYLSDRRSLIGALGIHE